MTQVWLLLRLRLRLYLAELRRTPAMIVMVVAAAAALIAGFVGLSFAFDGIDRFAPAAADALVLVTFAAVGMFQLLASMRWSVDRLLLSSDLELLLAAPIRVAALFGAKVVELAFASPISLLLLVGLSGAYGQTRLGPLGILAGLVAPLVLALLAALPGMLLTIAIARVVPPARLRAVLGLLPLLASLIYVLAGPAVGLIAPRFGDDATRVQETFVTVRAGLRWLPTSWPANVLLGAGDSSLPVVALQGVMLAVAGAALIAVTLSAFVLAYEEVRGRIAVAGRVRRGSFLERFTTPLAPAVRAIVLKDWKVTVRDLRAVAGLFFPLIVFGGLAVLSVLDRDEGGVSPAPVLGILVVAGSLAGSALLGERRNIAILRAAPLRPREILTAKVVVFFVPAVVAAWASTIGLGLVAGRSGPEIVALVGLVTWSIAAMMIASVAANALWADFAAERPRLGALRSMAGLFVGMFLAGSTSAVVGWTAGRITGSLDGPLAHPLAGAGAVVGLQISAVLLVSLVRAAERRLAVIDAP